MSLIDTATAHYQHLPRQSLAVEEWAAMIYWRPFTLGERIRLREAITRQGEALATATLVALKAEDADGNRLFADADIDTLAQQTDGAVLQRLGEAMMAVGTSVDQEKKD